MLDQVTALNGNDDEPVLMRCEDMESGLVCQGELLITASALKGVAYGRARRISHRNICLTDRPCEER
jgi:hypothetical protein